MSRPVDAWQLADIPDQAGRTIMVTGPSVGGLGHVTALELARRGARVVLAGRTQTKLDDARAAIEAEVPGADLEPLLVDVSDLASVRRAAAEAGRFGPLHVLVNNAGVMGTKAARTADGIELQLATNHFGPFALTGLLLPQLVDSEAGRVVTVSSNLHRAARSAPLEDPRAPARRTSPWLTYARSKLANLLFTFELDRRCRTAEIPVLATAAHPGFAGSHLAVNGQYGRTSGGIATILDAAIKAVSQPVAHGAWPTLMAATADLPGGTYCGPGGLGEMGGAPQVVTARRLAHDETAQRRLWELSEQVTGVTYP